jgi:hypothetical protein
VCFITLQGVQPYTFCNQTNIVENTLNQGNIKQRVIIMGKWIWSYCIILQNPPKLRWDWLLVQTIAMYFKVHKVISFKTFLFKLNAHSLELLTFVCNNIIRFFCFWYCKVFLSLQILTLLQFHLHLLVYQLFVNLLTTSPL